MRTMVSAALLSSPFTLLLPAAGAGAGAAAVAAGATAAIAATAAAECIAR
jgi:hypothetical protein